MLGYFALAPALSRTYPDPQRFQPRFYQGPAFDTGADQVFKVSAQEWPTFRHDMQRSGTSSTSVPDKLKVLWKKHIGTRPTASVCAGGILYVAARDDHVLHALNAESGDEIWRCQTAGRIDSPPTIAKGLAVFGCADGWVRCVRARDGVLVWRYRAAPEERQIVVKGQLESLWPLHGATLLKDGNVYCAAGRSSIIDAGISVFCLDLVSGKVLHQALCNLQALKQQPKSYGMGQPLPSDALLEVMSADENNIYMRHHVFDPDLKSTKNAADHFFTFTGFVDDDYFHRGYWAWSNRLSRYRTAWEKAAGFIKAIAGQKAYAYARKQEYYIGHIKGFERHLCSMDLKPKQEPLTKNARCDEEPWRI
jgi:hypothetical protein